MQAACRAAFTQTAGYFCAGMRGGQWRLTDTFTLDGLQDGFQQCFHHVVNVVAPHPDQESTSPRFSLRTGTPTNTPENNNSRLDASRQNTNPFQAASSPSSAQVPAGSSAANRPLGGEHEGRSRRRRLNNLGNPGSSLNTSARTSTSDDASSQRYEE